MDLGGFTEPQQGATFDDLLRVARKAEDLGHDAFFRSDHNPGDGNRRPASPGAANRPTCRLRPSCENDVLMIG